MPPRKLGKSHVTQMKVVTSAVEITKSERTAAIGLLSFGAVPLIITWVRLLKEPSSMSEWVTLTILGLYSFALIETISMILLKGLRRIELSDSAMHWLGGMALAEIAPMAWYIIKKIL